MAGFDAIVVGVGGMGSAALYHLAARGRRVLGLDRFGVPNELGSSHGLTRIIRLAYYEDSAYVPLLRRAYELWRELESAAGERLLHITGSVDAGPGLFEGSLRSCEEHGLAHEVLTGAELTARFPAYRFPAETAAVLQPDGGFLLPERCIGAHVEQAQARGAVLHEHERVLEWAAAGAGFWVRTELREYRTERLVLCPGAWAAGIAGLPVEAERQVLAWLRPTRPELFAPERFPVFNVAVTEGRYYGFPAFGVPGFKLGRYHHLGERVDPDDFDREPGPRDEEVLRAFAARYFPEGDGPAELLTTCLFENSRDEHFILDRHEGVVVAAGFSGHGFKFCSVVGEILADLALDGVTRHEIGFLRLSRFGGAGTSMSPPG